MDLWNFHWGLYLENASISLRIGQMIEGGSQAHNIRSLLVTYEEAGWKYIMNLLKIDKYNQMFCFHKTRAA